MPSSCGRRTHPVEQIDQVQPVRVYRHRDRDAHARGDGDEDAPRPFRARVRRMLQLVDADLRVVRGDRARALVRGGRARQQARDRHGPREHGRDDHGRLAGAPLERAHDARRLRVIVEARQQQHGEHGRLDERSRLGHDRLEHDCRRERGEISYCRALRYVSYECY